ncbi:MAG: SAM-dependent methyltransferase [Paludibacteraceae bacterium]|nr:SAM-dependent methyltransferase [Paludibacteraceae bacterium]
MIEELALQRDKYKHLSDDEWRWFLQQVEGRERTADKLPTFAAIDDWWYPVRLSCEQCSSELTARYKVSLLSAVSRQYSALLDLTGGYGVDTYFLSECFAHTDYVEQNAELCRIAAHNFERPTPALPKGKEITIHNCTAEEFLHRTPHTVHPYSLIFLDPARRDSHGGKVFRLEDCTPNVVELLPTLLAHGKRLMIKLSPMLDLTQAVKALSQVSWDIHIVAVKNEVKEVLLLSHQPSEVGSQAITAIDLSRPEQVFVFTREEERDCLMESGECKLGEYLYEPNAAILKAGAYKLAGKRFGLRKLDVNTHLYCSDTLAEDFPGRVWQIKNEGMKGERMKGEQANVICRNYPLTPESLKKKLHLKDGGTTYIIGCRVCGKPTLLRAERLS